MRSSGILCERSFRGQFDVHWNFVFYQMFLMLCHGVPGFRVSHACARVWQFQGNDETWLRVVSTRCLDKGTIWCRNVG